MKLSGLFSWREFTCNFLKCFHDMGYQMVFELNSALTGDENIQKFKYNATLAAFTLQAWMIKSHLFQMNHIFIICLLEGCGLCQTWLYSLF